MAGRKQISGRAVADFPPRSRTRWDFSAVADGHVYLLRRGQDFDIEVVSLAVAARNWARENDYRLTTRSEFDEEHPNRPRVGLYVRFTRQQRLP